MVTRTGLLCIRERLRVKQMSNNENNRLNVGFTPDCNAKDNVASSNSLKNTLNVINNRAQHFAKIAQSCLEEVRTLLAQVREYAAQNTNVTVEYVTNKVAELRNTIENALRNYLLKSELNSELISFGNAAQYVNSTQLSAAIASVIPDTANNSDKLLSTDGEDLLWVPVHHDYSIFDIIPKDHILSYEETKGFAQLGSYVYKEAVAGSRYGYPDFYAKVLSEYQDTNNTTETVSGVTITVNANGHKFYDIADKADIDSLFTARGEAWFYGIDTTNERIFLPRSTRIKFGTDAGEYQEAGLPNITGIIQGGRLGTPASGAFYHMYQSSTQAGTGYPQDTFGFDASRSSSIYGNSNTVEYSSTKLVPYMVVGNVSDWSGMTDVVNQGMTILEQVNQGLISRASTDLDNMSNAGKIIGSSLGMPSNSYTDLTLGASGSTYTAPANGWFAINKGTIGNQFVYIFNLSSKFNVAMAHETGNWFALTYMPVKKGDIIQVDYNAQGTLEYFRFIYAVGSESEAV